MRITKWSHSNAGAGRLSRIAPNGSGSEPAASPPPLPLPQRSASEQPIRDIELIVDYREIAGYTVIPDTCPSWKRYLFERRNERLVEDYVREKQAAINDHFKWLGVPAWKRRIMEELARRREEAARAEAEARERDLADARRVLALPPWLRELVLQKRVLCVSLTPELERVLRRDEERGRGRPDAADLPPSPPPPAIATTTTETPTTATRRTEEDAEGEGSLGAGNGEGERRDEGITKSDENGAGVVKEADLNDVQDSIKEGSRKWVHRFASTGTKTGSDPKPLASSREGFTPFKESACSSSYGRPTAGSSRLLSLSNGFTFEGSGSGGLWNGHLGGGGRSDPLHLSILSVNMGSGATRTHDESRNAKGPQSKGNPFDGSASHLDTPVGEMLRDGADTSTSPGGGWTSLTPAYSTLTRNENGAGVTGSQMRAVTRDGRIQLRCAPPFVLTRRIP